MNTIITQEGNQPAQNGADEGQTQDGQTACATLCVHTEQRHGRMEEPARVLVS